MQLAPIFQDHAVFQRDHPIPVWGTAAPETRITVQLADLTALAVTGSDGRWIARLPACPAGGPHALYIEADDGSPAVVCEDILVGEVWVCSGQSNMEYPLNQLDPNGDQSRGANFPHLRLLTLSTPAKGSLQTAIDGRWAPATSDSMAKFSAVAGWFGRSLAPLNVPVGLIANAWGGTRIQAWLSREALMSDPDGRQELARYEPLLHSAENTTFFGNYDDWFRACGPEDSQNAGIRDGWHRPDFDDAGWPSMNLPCHWQDHGHDHSGIFWFRRRVALPPAWHGRDLLLNLGAIDKHDDTFVNGHRIGGIAWENLNSWCTPRHYPVPAQFHDGASELVIAVRVRSHQYHGGMTGPAATMHIHPSDDPAATIALAGDWAFTVEQNWGIIPAPVLADCGPGGPNAPYSMFASRLHPLIPYALRGFIWYQGESNTSEAALYRRLLPLMIADWRRVWGQGDVPFLQVQLANYLMPQERPVESQWADLRAAQAAALSDPRVGLAVAIDVGEADDIHPRDKKSVGQRLAQWALSRVYGLPLIPSGPLLRSLGSAGDRLILAFDHATGLTTTDGGPVRHVAIAGNDRRFRWAESRIVGEQLEVWHPAIQKPTTVRYAWADNPEGCNLVNQGNLPAAPFDTDELPVSSSPSCDPHSSHKPRVTTMETSGNPCLTTA